MGATGPPARGQNRLLLALGRKEKPEAATSLWEDAWRRLKRNRAAVGSMVFLVLIMRLLAKGRRERYSRCGTKAGS